MSECRHTDWIPEWNSHGRIRRAFCHDCGIKIEDMTDRIRELTKQLAKKSAEFCHEVEQHGKTRKRLAKLQQQEKQ